MNSPASKQALDLTRNELDQCKIIFSSSIAITRMKFLSLCPSYPPKRAPPVQPLKLVRRSFSLSSRGQFFPFYPFSALCPSVALPSRTFPLFFLAFSVFFCPPRSRYSVLVILFVLFFLVLSLFCSEVASQTLNHLSHLNLDGLYSINLIWACEQTRYRPTLGQSILWRSGQYKDVPVDQPGEALKACVRTKIPSSSCNPSGTWTNNAMWVTGVGITIYAKFQSLAPCSNLFNVKIPECTYIFACESVWG
ncbi:hypothetical protein VNO77_34470 [Canavalia gladiata]|uniref:Uncharacterized protein n=1 Tax=Canavalia gladiata TaxID=3824 RepID=A0AAN9Q1T8_CANGL